MKNILILGVLILAFASASAQETKKQTRKEKRAAREAMLIEQTKTVLENKVYVFSATQVLPTGMRSRSLTTNYNVKVENDTITCYLPYFGKAHTAAYGGNQSPMDFIGSVENYKFEKTKKGYEVKFEVSNKSDRLVFFFQIGETGSASLNVNSTNRSSISYHGNIEKVKEKK